MYSALMPSLSASLPPPSLPPSRPFSCTFAATAEKLFLLRTTKSRRASGGKLSGRVNGNEIFANLVTHAPAPFLEAFAIAAAVAVAAVAVAADLSLPRSTAPSLYFLSAFSFGKTRVQNALTMFFGLCPPSPSPLRGHRKKRKKIHKEVLLVVRLLRCFFGLRR